MGHHASLLISILQELLWVVKVARSMRRQGLEGLSTTSFRCSSPKTRKQCHNDDLCQRSWDQGGLNKVQITDITYLRCRQVWVYLCAIRGGHSRRVVGYSMRPDKTSELVIEALTNARLARGLPPSQVIVHADCGSQFTSDRLTNYAQNENMKISLDQTGMCWDNAMTPIVLGKSERRAFPPACLCYQG